MADASAEPSVLGAPLELADDVSNVDMAGRDRASQPYR